MYVCVPCTFLSATEVRRGCWLFCHPSYRQLRATMWLLSIRPRIWAEVASAVSHWIISLALCIICSDQIYPHSFFSLSSGHPAPSCIPGPEHCTSWHTRQMFDLAAPQIPSIFISYLLFWDRVALCSPGWPWTSDPPNSASQVQGSITGCTNTPR